SGRGGLSVYGRSYPANHYCADAIYVESTHLTDAGNWRCTGDRTCTCVIRRRPGQSTGDRYRGQMSWDRFYAFALLALAGTGLLTPIAFAHLSGVFAYFVQDIIDPSASTRMLQQQLD